MLIRNPVLPGSHPDPSAVRVGRDYYVATSTFEWFPGIRIHGSRDLVHWRLVGHALTTRDQLDLRGVPDSGGVWAPSLTHDGALFHLVYSVVTDRRAFPLVALANFLVTAREITGPWSAPIFLNGSGWDPSLFHDDDGRKWLLNMTLDHRPGECATKGIVLQEYDPAARRLVGPVRRLFAGTALGCTEGPQLFRHAGHHFLVTAEGGTSWDHAVTVARAARLEGPYEPDPRGPLLTARGAPDLPLQKAGHAGFFSTDRGEWFVAHLCARPVGSARRSPLGRETALQRIRWTADGWPRLDDGGHHPQVEVRAPDLPPAVTPAPPARDDFDGEALSPAWSTLRVPADESWASLRRRPGHLSLRGRAPLFSKHEQSLVAQRWRSLRAVAETVVEFEPESFHEAAGLVCYYDTRDFLYLAVTHDDGAGKCALVTQMDRGRYVRAATPPIPLARGARCHLRAEVDGAALRFSISEDGARFRPVGGTFDATQLSDEHGDKDGFTGAFVGLAAQDLATRSRTAEFDHFCYREDDGNRA
jgi:xylan 1,4-beta-xylosidase